jgi:serine/threonine-protein kinase
MTSKQENNKLLFNKFRVIECLKKDIFSSVYLAHHEYLGKKILLKTLNTEDITETTWLARFKREAKILARLDHSNIIKVLDFGSHEKDFYISFEYFESKDLRSYIKQTKLTKQQNKDILVQIARGLFAAHQEGIVHRDIKPENVLINSQQKVKIADFGLATTTDENLVTRKSSIVGTPAYMSPEQIRGEKLSEKSDLFSLGVLAFELYTGKNPFIGEDVNSTINNILNFDPQKLPPELATLPSDISILVEHLLQPNIKQRLQSAQLILQKLDSQEYQMTEQPVLIKRPIQYKYYLISVIILTTIIFAIFLTPNNEHQSSISTVNNMAENSVPSNDSVTLDAVAQIQKSTIDDIRLENNRKLANTETRLSKQGKLFFQSIPTSKVFIDSKQVQFGTLEDFKELSPGEHVLDLYHEAYPVYRREINIESGQNLFLKIELDTLFGYLKCQIFPWGNVFLNGETYGQSPFLKPLTLQSGQYQLTIRNPDYPIFTDSILITQQETTFYKIDLESANIALEADSI